MELVNKSFVQIDNVIGQEDINELMKDKQRASIDKEL